jgi:hypothetical protein
MIDRTPHREDDVRDARLAALLRSADAAPEPDWDRLHASIVARAALPLARLRKPPAWWELTASWARAAVPIAVAASIALAVAIARDGATPGSDLVASTTTSLTVRDALEDAITTPETESELLPALMGSEEWLVSAAFERQ